MCFQSLGWEDPLEEGMAIHSSIFTWEISQIQEPGGLLCSQGHKELDTTEATQHTCMTINNLKRESLKSLDEFHVAILKVKLDKKLSRNNLIFLSEISESILFEILYKFDTFLYQKVFLYYFLYFSQNHNYFSFSSSPI